MSLLILSLQLAPTAAFIRASSMKGIGDKYDAFIFLHIKALSSGCFLPKWRRDCTAHNSEWELFFKWGHHSGCSALAPQLSQSQEAWTKASHTARKTVTLKALHKRCLLCRSPQRSDPFSSRGWLRAPRRSSLETVMRRQGRAEEMVSIKGRESDGWH